MNTSHGPHSFRAPDLEEIARRQQVLSNANSATLQDTIVGEIVERLERECAEALRFPQDQTYITLSRIVREVRDHYGVK